MGVRGGKIKIITLVGSTCKDHTSSPRGYLQWHSWAQRMSQTHRQVRCEQCGLWVIWVPKKGIYNLRTTPGAEK